MKKLLLIICLMATTWNIMATGIADKNIHKNAGGSDKKCSHQSYAPLQG